MLVGRLWPQLGGDERYLDVLGVNYYPNNQWVLDGPTLQRDDPRYRPFRDLLREAWERYGRPLVVAETGSQDDARAEWLRYIAGEVRAARREGVPVGGICLYPILNYPGWDDDRHCQSGLWGYPGPGGHRDIHVPLAQELARQIELFRSEPGVSHPSHQAPLAQRERGEEETDYAAY